MPTPPPGCQCLCGNVTFMVDGDSVPISNENVLETINTNAEEDAYKVREVLSYFPQRQRLLYAVGGEITHSKAKITSLFKCESLGSGWKVWSCLNCRAALFASVRTADTRALVLNAAVSENVPRTAATTPRTAPPSVFGVDVPFAQSSSAAAASQDAAKGASTSSSTTTPTATSAPASGNLSRGSSGRKKKRKKPRRTASVLPTKLTGEPLAVYTELGVLAEKAIHAEEARVRERIEQFILSERLKLRAYADRAYAERRALFDSYMVGHAEETERRASSAAEDDALAMASALRMSSSDVPPPPSVTTTATEAAEVIVNAPAGAAVSAPTPERLSRTEQLRRKSGDRFLVRHDSSDIFLMDEAEEDAAQFRWFKQSSDRLGRQDSDAAYDTDSIPHELLRTQSAAEPKVSPAPAPDAPPVPQRVSVSSDETDGVDETSGASSSTLTIDEDERRSSGRRTPAAVRDSGRARAAPALMLSQSLPVQIPHLEQAKITGGAFGGGDQAADQAGSRQSQTARRRSSKTQHPTVVGTASAKHTEGFAVRGTGAETAAEPPRSPVRKLTPPRRPMSVGSADAVRRGGGGAADDDFGTGDAFVPPHALSHSLQSPGREEEFLDRPSYKDRAEYVVPSHRRAVRSATMQMPVTADHERKEFRWPNELEKPAATKRSPRVLF